MKRSVLRYWLLLFLPTLVISVSAFRLLRYEQDRISHSFQAAHSDRAQAVAHRLKQTVQSVEDSMLASLKGFSPTTVVGALPQWVGQNPLVRNVYIWSKSSGLRYPLLDQSATQEERRFITRYAMLFDGRHPWAPAGKEQIGGGSGSIHGSFPPMTKSRPDAQRAPSPSTGSDNLLDMARSRPSESSSVSSSVFRDTIPPKTALDTIDGGWLPWFTDNRLYLIGWVHPPNHDLVWGVELELATLLSRLILDFPQPSTNQVAYVLSDGAGQILHQSGGNELDDQAAPGLAVSLAPILPHWQVGVYFNGGERGNAAGQGYLIISGMMLVIVIAAILFGGMLLYRDAERNRRDAERKTSFVANVSHELKTPLTSIRMYAELIKEGRVKSIDKQKSYMQVIVDESRRLGRLVNNLLDFSRLEQGRKTYRIEPLDITAFLKEFDRAHRLRIENEDLALVVQLPPKNLQVNTDRDVLEQVLLNLVDNAVKYAGDGKTLTIALDPVDTGGQICVLDRGPGISSKYRHRIFEKYYRADDSLTAEHPGSGLGLTIARQLMRDLGGDLRYEPRRGGGCCFKIIISEN